VSRMRQAERHWRVYHHRCLRRHNNLFTLRTTNSQVFNSPQLQPMPVCARCRKDQDYDFSGHYCHKCQNEMADAANHAKQLSEINETTYNLATRVGRLEFEMQTMAKRFDLLIEATSKSATPPPPWFYMALYQWMQSNPTPLHIAITGLSPAQILEAGRALQERFPHAKVAHSISVPADLLGILTNVENGEILILSRPELWSDLANQMLQSSCATFKVHIAVDNGPAARMVSLNLPLFRAILLSAGKEYVPHGVAVVWPPDAGIDVLNQDPDL
jgi:hypothetical protein